MLLLIPLLATLAADTTRAPDAGLQDAMVAVHRQPSLPLVSLRLALLVDDPPGYAGAGHLFQHLLAPTLEEQASRVGGRVQLQRTSDAVIYTLTGPSAELDYLAGILRSVLDPPEVGEGDVYVASRALYEERLAEWETAPSHVRAALRQRLFPQDLSAAGTEQSAERFHSDTLKEIWALLYRAGRVSVTAVGNVEMGRVQRAFASLPEPDAAVLGSPRPDSIAFRPLAPAEATQAWLGHAYLASDLDPAAVSVATHLLGDLLRGRLAEGSVEVEHWWTHHGQAVVLVAAVPGTSMAAAQRTLGTAVTTLAERLSDASVREAARAIRRDMLFYSRTPERMAQVLGQFTDRAGDPDAADHFYAGLEAVRVDDVAVVLRGFARQTPMRVDLPPQRLNR